MGMMPEQVKGRIRNIAKRENADPRTLMRIYMMERFLDRIAASNYRDNFILKGGVLVTAMVGVALRSTMDIDTTIKNRNISEESAQDMILEICGINLNDNVTFEITNITRIMDEMEYPGIRFNMNAYMGKMITPMKIDISTGDVITPHAIEYKYNLLLENRFIELWAYNLETILAEKLQTILSRGVLNTRMRDFYDIHILLSIYGNEMDQENLRKAFVATCRKRGTENLKGDRYVIFGKICEDANLSSRWNAYRKKYPYAASIPYENILYSIEILMAKIYPKVPNTDTLRALEESDISSHGSIAKGYSNINEMMDDLRK